MFLSVFVCFCVFLCLCVLCVCLCVRVFCEGDGDVVGVVTPLGGVAQAFHGDQVVELRVVKDKWK